MADNTKKKWIFVCHGTFYGGPSAYYVKVEENIIKSLLDGTNLIGESKILGLKAKVNVNEHIYVMLVYRSKIGTNLGVLSFAEFRKELRKYRASSTWKMDCYVVRMKKNSIRNFNVHNDQEIIMKAYMG